MNINNESPKYLEVSLNKSKGTFSIQTTEKKPKESALDTLKKINYIVKHNLNPERSLRGGTEKADLSTLKEKAEQIRDNYMQKHSKLNWFGQLFSKITSIKKEFTKIEKSVQTQEATQRQQNLADIEKAAKLGYKGLDPGDARKFTQNFTTELQALCLSPPLSQHAVFEGNKIDTLNLEKTIDNLKKLNSKAIIGVLADETYQDIKAPLVKKYLLNEAFKDFKVSGDGQNVVEKAIDVFIDANRKGDSQTLDFLNKKGLNLVEKPKSNKPIPETKEVEDAERIEAKMTALRSEAVVQAVENLDVDQVIFLLDAGISPDAKPVDRTNTPLLNLLKDYAANPNDPEDKKMRRIEIFSLLVKKGADMNAVSYDGHTPLFYIEQSKDEKLFDAFYNSHVQAHGKPETENDLYMHYIKK